MIIKILKFIVVDDNDAFRGAIKMYLINQLGAEIIGEASNADEALKLNNLH